MRGAWRLLPVFRPLTPPWDLGVFLEGFKGLPIWAIAGSLKHPSLKIAPLLGLASAKWVSDIHVFPVRPSLSSPWGICVWFWRQTRSLDLKKWVRFPRQNFHFSWWAAIAHAMSSQVVPSYMDRTPHYEEQSTLCLQGWTLKGSTRSHPPGGGGYSFGVAVCSHRWVCMCTLLGCVLGSLKGECLFRLLFNSEVVHAFDFCFVITCFLYQERVWLVPSLSPGWTLGNLPTGQYLFVKLPGNTGGTISHRETSSKREEKHLVVCYNCSSLNNMS